MDVSTNKAQLRQKLKRKLQLKRLKQQLKLAFLAVRLHGKSRSSKKRKLTFWKGDPRKEKLKKLFEKQGLNTIMTWSQLVDSITAEVGGGTVQWFQ